MSARLKTNQIISTYNMSTVTFGFTAEQIVDEGRTKWEDINLLKTWLKNQNLPKLTDEQIAFFLLSCFNEQEPTRSTIKAYYSAKNRCPAIFDDRNIEREDIQKQLKTVELCYFPERTDDGCVVVLERFHDTYYGNYEQLPTMKLFYMTLDAALYENPPEGLIIIMDLKGLGLRHLSRFNFSSLKIFLQYLQDGLPMRLKKIHIFNTVYFIDKILLLLKPFFRKELLNMIVFHQTNMDMELFYEKWLPKRCVPKDYGGDLPSVQVLHQNNIDKLAKLQNHFEEEELQRHSIR